MINKVPQETGFRSNFPSYMAHAGTENRNQAFYIGPLDSQKTDKWGLYDKFSTQTGITRQNLEFFFHFS